MKIKMQYSEIVNFTLSVFGKYTEEDVQLDSEIGTMHIDSLNYVKIIIELEDNYGIEIDDETLYVSNGIKIKNFVDFIYKSVS